MKKICSACHRNIDVSIDFSAAHEIESLEKELTYDSIVMTCPNCKKSIVVEIRLKVPRKIPEGSIRQGTNGLKTPDDLPYDSLDAIRFESSIFAVTGQFQNYEDEKRNEIDEMIISRGGIVKNSVTQKTNYLIVGSLQTKTWQGLGGKIRRAIELKNQGFSIHIVREKDFFDLLDKKPAVDNIQSLWYRNPRLISVHHIPKTWEDENG